MIDRYEGDALRQVDLRIAELSGPDGDDNEACKIWQQVRQAVLAMLEEPPGNPTH